MSDYWYPQEAINSQAQLEELVKQARNQPIKLWFVRPPLSEWLITNPQALLCDTYTKITYRDDNYTIRVADHAYFWSPLGEACFPYGTTASRDPKDIGYLFTNYWLAVGYAIRAKVYRPSDVSDL